MLPRSFGYSWRNWRRNPGFTLTAIGVLAVGIGASTAIFTVADGLLLRPLPYSQPDRLLLLSGSTPDQAESGGALSYPLFTLISERSRSFNSLAACPGRTESDRTRRATTPGGRTGILEFL